VIRLEVFDKRVLKFLDNFSKELLRYKIYPELIALGFWLRKSNIEKIKKNFLKKYENYLLLSRGVVFHIAPKNVDTIFVYSFVLSLLCGNKNIIRISPETNEQVELILAILDETLNELKEYVKIVRYKYEKTEYYSLMCDVRVIWGGDESILNIRKIPIKPTATELVFADKFSYLLLKASEFNESFYEKFFRDSFTFMQNACSSIRCICFYQMNDEEIEKFWRGLEEFLKDKVEIETKQIIDKLTTECVYAANCDIKVVNNPYFYRIKLNSINDVKRELHTGFGLFYEVKLNNLDEFFSFTNKKDQTLVVYGIEKEEIIKSMKKNSSGGIDRIVRLGSAMEFNFVWDGYDMLSNFCRIVDVNL
jgi:hypothetical protein